MQISTPLTTLSLPTLLIMSLAVSSCGSVQRELSAPHPSQQAGLVIDERTGPNPWTHLNFDDDAEDFTFAIISDLTGGYREGIFPDAITKLNLVHPEFVISVGDLIEGLGHDRQGIEAEWDEFDAMLAPLRAPFFYVAGNHDYGNEDMNAVWQSRLGRSYYHFIYRGVLFLILNTEDGQPAPMDPEIVALNAEYERLRPIDPAAAQIVGERLMAKFDFEGDMPGRFSPQQVTYIEETLARISDVRHTVVFMHQPIWQGQGSPQMELLAEALVDRPYTVFAGHLHNYRRFERHGNRLIRLGTTGGGWATAANSPNSFDHITLVTMTADGPVIANLRLDGIVDEHGYSESAPADAAGQ